MALPTLESVTDGLNRLTMDVLGEDILYAADGAAFATVRGHVDYSDAERAFEASRAIEQDIRVAVLIEDVPERPSKTARVRLAKHAALFKPVNPRLDQSGDHWEFEVSKVADA